MKKKSAPNSIAENRKARHDYTLEEHLEAGIVLEGWEVTSIRAGHVQLNQSYVIIKNGEAWLLGSHITPLSSASTHINPDPMRTRKLLLKKRELNKLIHAVERKGYTLVPLALYWKGAHVKARVAVAKGKQTHDKRAAAKEKEWKREAEKLRKSR